MGISIINVQNLGVGHKVRVYMLVEMNARGNGACPFCSFAGSCHVQETLIETLDKFSSEDNPMELVIYSCPYFDEK